MHNSYKNAKKCNMFFIEKLKGNDGYFFTSIASLTMQD